MRSQYIHDLAVMTIAVCANFAFGSQADARTRIEPLAEQSASRHYIDFVARPTQAFGHSYVRLITVGRDGREVVTKTVGFYPAGKNERDVFDTRGAVTATKADMRANPRVRYRLAISELSYAKASANLGRLSQTWTRYDLLDHNCNHMVGAIARSLGLATSGDYDDTPENYVRSLVALNGGRERASWRG